MAKLRARLWTINRLVSIFLLSLCSDQSLSSWAETQQAPAANQQQQQFSLLPATSSLNNPFAAFTINNNLKPVASGSVSSASVASLSAPIVAQPSQAEQATQLVGSDQAQVQPAPPNYGAEDPIVYLDYSTINDEILNKNTANFVFFNANYNNCRHCSRLFDIWKELAVDLRWWRQVVKLFSINCSEDDNLEVCKRADVTQLPQVRFYWIQSQSLDQDGQRMRILGKSVHALRHLIMDKLFDSYTAHNKLLSQKSSPLVVQQPLISQLLSAGNGVTGASSGLLGALMASGGLSNLLGQSERVGQVIGSLLNANGIRASARLQPMPSNWPELDAIEVADTQQLLDMQPLDPAKSHIGALLVMETPEFLYNGLEVTLDLCPYSNFVYIARVKDPKSQLTKNLTRRDDVQAPALIYVNSARESKLIVTAPKYTNDEDLRRIFVRSFERRQIKSPVKRLWSMPSQAIIAAARSQPSGDEDSEIKANLNSVYLNDLTNALRISLMDQVFRHPDLSDDQYNAIVKYVYVIINYFPFQTDESLKFFKRLHSWLQNQVSPVEMGEYKKQFHDIDELLPLREWAACRSFTSTKSLPAAKRKGAGQSLFENPAQLGKMVSNITKFLRSQQHQAGKLTSIINVLATNNAAMSSSSNKPIVNKTLVESIDSTQRPVRDNLSAIDQTNGPSGAALKLTSSESPIERIIKSLTSSSESSILKLIANTFSGASSNKDLGAKKSKFSREYPCGAWKLAHILVVNEYLKDSPRKDVKHIVLHSLYQYAMQFYACSTCGNRVSDINNEFRINLDEQLNEQSDSVMFLWKIHNRINKRLEAEIRPNSPPKLQFPTESLCPKCRSPKSQTESMVSTPNWHEKQVLNFLVHYYRPQNLIMTRNSSDSAASSAISPIQMGHYHKYIYLIGVGPLMSVLLSSLSNCCLCIVILANTLLLSRSIL